MFMKSYLNLGKVSAESQKRIFKYEILKELINADVNTMADSKHHILWCTGGQC